LEEGFGQEGLEITWNNGVKLGENGIKFPPPQCSAKLRNQFWKGRKFGTKKDLL